MQPAQLFIAFASSFAITVAGMPFIIGYFRMRKQGQEIRDEGPKWHNSKAGTPTMGGLGFLAAAVITTIWFSLWTHKMTTSLMILVFVLLLYGIIGFLDDFIKLAKKQNEGLTSSQKFIAQVVVAIIFYVVYRMEGYPNTLNFFGIDLPLNILYGLFVIFWLVGFSNAVNLTDGIDGLVSGLGTISFATYGIIAWNQQQYEVLIVCLAVMGGLVGFFPYNRKPAKIFMGDVGSLALGGLLAAVSIILHQEWTLLLVGLVYIFETASVIIQVTSFKMTGKRVFKMSPLHHHFEMSGWSEWKVDTVFWAIGLIASIIVLLIVL
ncbi:MULTISPECIES: phospho-N-acetylmuramoyl-pentapeptide-transferase [Enterococcus]|uniref:Phospho-N-acetylmuramoyl-pentapeptide-transferase n=1 Tax=Enterococcus malodoratus ATCC 43197 TaxID=1158601 RepID=R2R5Y0_9ENTE|nr:MULTISPECIES: phospho-N-acetylmuramoyl-pentapeptide-transferase [Enterococcus]EOH78995.1 phospho-N-acetylmuramoyl-pentapeptide-transferase [Enterococcus malodoratus ATCC 43197]EOT64580.1 phospho-N-acetylmuramoyl-pentapeptide-transferase [Enterococcus malodoratus ATCC 43197]OJG65620.1 phospho-N-acetylmuramoyl-pentapeptide-transferase [Enterococcus malodoratus]SES63277.1 Phospho-N-acetylmuramoyl-pentapeptide-transferase [Enterococcus malodoratus]SPW92620.1 phospho-N-acetylmuramoyl-pentapeptid